MRKLASIQKIKSVNQIPNADNIEVVSFESIGWKTVAKKGEFKTGDLCVYLEIDSLFKPDWWNQFLADKNTPEKPIRLKTITFRGQLSQGLAVSLTEKFDFYNDVKEGDDITELLGVEKYEPPIPACLGGDAIGNFPGYVKKTDEDRIQAYPSLIDECQGKFMDFTLKADGTSATYVNMDDFHHVCSRNRSLRESEKNTYWQMYHQYNLKEILNSHPYHAIQGEIVGPGIQKNRMGIKEHTLMVFDVYDVKSNRYFDLDDMIEFCNRYGLTTVPIHKRHEIFQFNSVDELLIYAEDSKYPNGDIAEGYVIRGSVNSYSKVLNGRLSFKAINNKYLKKHSE